MGVSISISSITQNSQSIANNTSNVTVKLTAKWTYGTYNHYGYANGYLIIDGTKYTFSNVIINPNRTTSGSQTLITKTVDVKHGDDGTKTLSCSASFNTDLDSTGILTTSATKTLTTIPRKSTLSVGNGTLGTAQTLTVTRKSSSFTHTITAKCGSASATVCTKSSNTSVSFTPPLTWASQNTTGISVSVAYTITTYTGNTNVGSNSYTKTCSIPASVKPSCTISVTDPTGYKDKYGAYIKGYSKFKITVTPTMSYSSPIASYKVVANGSTYTKANSTTAVLKSSGTLSINATVTDKRGRTSTAATATASVLDYAKPKISKLSVGRCNADGTANDQGESVKVSYGYSISSLNNQNSSTCVLQYKKASDSEYITPSDFDASAGSYIFEADTGSSYDVLMTVTDNLSTTTKTTSVSTAFTIMHWKASGYGMAIGKISELDNVFDIGMQTRTLGGILHPVLEPNTDLNDVRTPNTYVGENVSTYNYGNCPLTSGTFTLEVVGMGAHDQVKQRLIACDKKTGRAWERIYYGSSWSEWVCVSDFDGRLLAEGAYYMSASQTVTLAEPVSKQRSGIVLVFSRYSSGVAQNYHFQTFFVPKYQISRHTGCGHTFMLTTDGTFGLFASKYLYINDTTIVGNDVNTAVGTGECGIKYTNNGFVLRYVIGV